MKAMAHRKNAVTRHSGNVLMLGLLLFVFVVQCPADDFDTIIERYRRSFQIEPTGSRADDSEVAPDKTQIAQWIASLDDNGSWPDLDYANADRAFWKASRHLDRVRAMAFVLAKANGATNTNLETATLRALDFWLGKRFQNPNWWWNQIGVPAAMRDIIVLLGEKLAGERRAGALEVLAQAPKPRSGGGANTVWIADLTLQYGALTRNAALVAESSRVISGEIKISSDEGIQSDFSFHQHSARLQQFAYGRSYFITTVRLAWQLRGTQWEIPPAKIQHLADFALNGCEWMCRGIYTVPSTLDRSASRPGALAAADLRVPLAQLRELLPDRAGELALFLARQNGRVQPLVGARSFPCSDFLGYHRPSFSFFLKTVSDRTLLSEVGLNSEHLKGALQNCGDHYLLRDGREYFDLAPVWDWNLLPGVTWAEGAGDLQRKRFTGAVCDGESCAAVMDYSFGTSNRVSLSARKFWACHGDLVMALIGNLNAPELNHPVRTALDQCLLRGVVTISSEQHATRTLARNEQNISVRWLHHAGLFYAPLGDLKVSVRVGPVTGSWKSINAALPPTPVTTPVFLAILEHGEKPKMQSGGFVIAPGSVEEAAKLFEQPVWRVLRNDSQAQAVRFADGTVMAAFYEPAEISAGDDSVSADAPCILIARKDRFIISDPAQRGGVVNIRARGKILKINLPPDGEVATASR